ncbi:hypothetical protein [Thalassobacillus sp. CUG 92003]|uniref:hypothetical protein n=1 Tax=Thalassobacillus sp. CUG 92003 TaxID=2736641 RepID=UPI0015E72A2A|nr:hypothetical protein [Thalassobacillus sp. CUG 92003]
MKNLLFLIAGKEEGFEFSDGKTFLVGNPDEAIETLRGEGYRIFYVAEEVRRVDDIIGQEE